MEETQQKHNELQELVAYIHSAETEAERMRTNYDVKIAQMLKKGREKIMEMREQYEKNAAETKNKILSSQREKTEKLVQKIISDAKNEATTLRTKKLDKKNIEAIFESFISSL